MTFRIRFSLTFLLLTTSLACFAQNPYWREPRATIQYGPAYTNSGSQFYNGRRPADMGYYPVFPWANAFDNGQSFGTLAVITRRTDAGAEAQQGDFDIYLERQRFERERRELAFNGVAPQAHANPEAPDQSELLKNSHDRDFILRNFHTMYVNAREAHYFDSQQMKAALGKNKEFAKLQISIVDDPRVADTVLNVGYTFAWDYPFTLRHQNTTIVLVSGKGEGPFSGPLGAADVARQFVNTVKAARAEKKIERK